MEIEKNIKKIAAENEQENARKWRNLEFYKERADISIEQVRGVTSRLLEMRDKAKDIGLEEKFTSVGVKCMNTTKMLEKIIKGLEQYLSK